MISAIILTKNEESNIAGCIESVCWADEVVVLDAESTDSTIEIAQKMGAKVFSHPFSNFSGQRNAAIELVRNDWIFFVDADERVPEKLANEIDLVIQDPEIDGWWVPRKNYYFGRLLHHGGFYPDYQLRLSRQGKLHYDPGQKVHEKPVLDGTAGHLNNPLIHFCYNNLQEMVTAKNKYSALLAEIHHETGLKPTYHLIAAPILTFFQQLFGLQGYKDGFLGFFISLVWAYYAFDEYRRTCLLWKSASKN
jgi:(heptosyl)LPS beta-1,4-glucosyltransferase